MCVLMLVCVYIVLYGNLSHKDVHVLLTQHTEVEVISMYVTSCVLLFVIKIELVLASEFQFSILFLSLLNIDSLNETQTLHWCLQTQC